MTRSAAPLRAGVDRRSGPEPLTAASWRHLSLIWMAGISLRITMLAVPPVLPAIHRALHLDETMVGALTSLPVMLLAAAAVPGSLLVSRVGARRALILGLCLVAAAGAMRGAGPATPLLFVMTFLMGLGVAVSQPALPALIRLWFPLRVGLATAAFANGMLIGEIIPASATVPLVLPLLGGSWPLSFVFWSAPVALTAVAVLLMTSHVERTLGTAPARWWPDWRSPLTWRVGLIFGCAATIYFNANAFVPDYLKAIHHPELMTPALTSLNLMQLPASFLVAALADRVVGRRWPLVAAGVLTLVALVGFLGSSGYWSVALVGILGFCAALGLTLNLALPPLLTDADDVHRLSAAMFTISYTCAFVNSLIGGAVWDATGIPAGAFIMVGIAGLVLIILALGLKIPRPTAG